MKHLTKRTLAVLTMVVLLYSVLTVGINAEWYEIGGGYTTQHFKRPFTDSFAEVYFTGDSTSHALTSGAHELAVYAYVDISCTVDSGTQFVWWYNEDRNNEFGHALASLSLYGLFDDEYDVTDFTSYHFYETNEGVKSNDFYMGTSSR